MKVDGEAGKKFSLQKESGNASTQLMLLPSHKPSPDSQALKNHHWMFFRAHAVRPRSSFLKAVLAQLLTRVSSIIPRPSQPTSL